MLITWRGFGLAAPAAIVVSLLVTFAFAATLWGVQSPGATAGALAASFCLAAVVNALVCAWIDRRAASIPSDEGRYRATWHSFGLVPLPLWTYIDLGFAALSLLLLAGSR